MPPQDPEGGAMRVVVWIAAETWRPAVDAARALAPADAEIVLVYVTGEEAAAARGAYAGLLGRGRPDLDPGRRMEQAAGAAATELFEAVAERLDRPCQRVQRSGRPEPEVIAAAAGADLLILVRDGDRSRPGPRSLGHASRFIVDHATCPVLLVWPERAPVSASMPPHPPSPPRPPRDR
jgi:nucleotide-binding universal stress UspA family protein